jgi:hypothetical protein
VFTLSQQAQKLGCFATMRLKLVECVATNQDAVARYNTSKVKPAVTSKTTNSLVSELLAATKRPFPQE